MSFVLVNVQRMQHHIVISDNKNFELLGISMIICIQLNTISIIRTIIDVQIFMYNIHER